MSRIKRLDPKLIDQIAAGEVVERPASVLKELLENAIDAQSTTITVRIALGGTRLIEVQDNGVGISHEDMSLALDPHTTSKIRTVDDLSSVTTLGFRGEALASLSSVSKLTILSLENSGTKAYEITSTGGEKSEMFVTSRNTGTTVTVEDLFYNVPARKKFLKTPKTEYRKLLDIFIPTAIINPHIHFVFESDGRKVYNFPAIKDVQRGIVHPQRLQEVIKNVNFVNLFYDGEDITVGGAVSHPKHGTLRTSNRYVFVNGRPVWDSGIVKSVTLGTSRFVPEGTKLPFAITVTMPSSQLDVNVHPRKAEVRFANPFRVYSAVERAVKSAFEKDLGKMKMGVNEDKEYHRFRKNGVVSQLKTVDHENFGTGKNYNVKESLQFSKMIIQDSADHGKSIQPGLEDATSVEASIKPRITEDQISKATQFLGRYIVASIRKELWIIDQHAAAERIRFEKLLDEYGQRKVEVQQLLTPIEIDASEQDCIFVEEQKKVLQGLGYLVEVKSGKVLVTGVPLVLSSGDNSAMFKKIVEDLQKYEDFVDKERHLKEKYRNSIIATLACHSSVRMNRRLSDVESLDIIRSLFSCSNSYSCPHGRPIVWRLSIGDVDSHFDRQ